MRALSVLILLLLCSLSFHVSAYADRVSGIKGSKPPQKVALVIGNSVYENVPHLPNPSNDADAMAAAFGRLGFDVTLAKDISVNSLRKTLATFAITAAHSDMAAIYYAGHGIEVEGKNYIIPVDAELENVVVAGFELISLEAIIDSMGGSSGLKLIFLDACRDNPFRQTMNTSFATRSIGRGLASIEPDSGIVISYAAKAGTVAYDGKGKHSPYTEALLDHMEEPGLELQFLFRRVRDAVLRQTARSQEPFFYGSLPDRAFYLNPAQQENESLDLSKANSDASVTSQSAEAAAAWHYVRNSSRPNEIEAYLAEYGPANRFYSVLARNRLTALINMGATDIGTALIGTDSLPQVPPATPVKGASGSSKRSEATLEDNAPEKAQQAGDHSRLNAARHMTEQTIFAKGAAPIDQDIDRRVLVLLSQAELNRLGCTSRNPDGIWGDKSRTDLKRFSVHAGLELASTDPSVGLLIMLRQNRGSLCPSICAANEETINGQCVATSCPAGQRLSSSGTCYVPRKNNVLKTANRPVAPRRQTTEQSAPHRRNAINTCEPGPYQDSSELCQGATGKVTRRYHPKICANGEQRNALGICTLAVKPVESTRQASRKTGRRRYNPFVPFDCWSDGIGGVVCE